MDWSLSGRKPFVGNVLRKSARCFNWPGSYLERDAEPTVREATSWPEREIEWNHGALGGPMQTGLVERINSRMRVEFLNEARFFNSADARDLIAASAIV